MSKIDDYRELLDAHSKARREFDNVHHKLEFSYHGSGLSYETRELVSRSMRDPRFAAIFHEYIEKEATEAKALASAEAREFAAELGLKP